MNQSLEALVSTIAPYDLIEQKTIKETISWIQSGVPLYRTQKSDVPQKHLVSYFIPVDKDKRKLLLVDHKKSGLWLPAGGHLEAGESPQAAVCRECEEELGVPAQFLQTTPYFLTAAETVGMVEKHIDVSFWYILKGNSLESYAFDSREFRSVHWFSFNEIPYEKSDPHMERFIEKLKLRL